jgi:hypothetical protein
MKSINDDWLFVHNRGYSAAIITEFKFVPFQCKPFNIKFNGEKNFINFGDCVFGQTAPTSPIKFIAKRTVTHAAACIGAGVSQTPTFLPDVPNVKGEGDFQKIGCRSPAVLVNASYPVQSLLPPCLLYRILNIKIYKTRIYLLFCMGVKLDLLH